MIQKDDIRLSFECSVRDTMRDLYNPDILEWNERSQMYKLQDTQTAYVWYKKGYLNGERN